VEKAEKYGKMHSHMEAQLRCLKRAEFGTSFDASFQASHNPANRTTL
jgi:hypothetical protein